MDTSKLHVAFTQPARYPLIDVLKAFAAQCIVLHHFSAYGPVSDAAQRIAPGLITVLYEYGRMAVQVFLVVAGYLAARGLTSSRDGARTPVVAIINRFVRLLGPYVFALVMAMLSAALARHWLNDEFVPDAPTLAQLLAHVGLLHGVLGYDALSSGVWYVAIDFQLYALLALVLWVGRGNTLLSRAVILVLCAASLLWFNRDTSLDNWAIYFFGAYGLGICAWWAGHPTSARDKTLFALVVAIAVAALLLDFRLRVALAVLVAIALAGWADQGMRLPAWLDRLIQQLSRTSYALFLVHFPVLLLINASYAGFGLTGADTALWCIATGWAASVGVAHVFHHGVERPLGRWRSGNRD